jgi:hypothetical protein
MTDEELKLIISGYSSIQIEGYTYNLPELENWLIKRGYLKADIAIMGLILLIKYKDDCVKLNELNKSMIDLIQRTEKLLSEIKSNESSI